jgi:hypothetical protein
MSGTALDGRELGVRVLLSRVRRTAQEVADNKVVEPVLTMQLHDMDVGAELSAETEVQTTRNTSFTKGLVTQAYQTFAYGLRWPIALHPKLDVHDRLGEKTGNRSAANVFDLISRNPKRDHQPSALRSEDGSPVLRRLGKMDRFVELESHAGYELPESVAFTFTYIPEAVFGDLAD